MWLLGPLRKTLYKHNVLGGFLEARNRKSAFGTKKDGNLAPKPDFHRKSVFHAKSWNSAKMVEISRNATFFALKSCSRSIQFLCFWAYCPNGRIHWNSPNFRKFLRILVKLAEICGISAFLRKNAIRAGNDQKCLPFRFIIATFWSASEKRAPPAPDSRNSRFSSEITEICEISCILVNFSEFWELSNFCGTRPAWPAWARTPPESLLFYSPDSLGWGEGGVFFSTFSPLETSFLLTRRGTHPDSVGMVPKVDFYDVAKGHQLWLGT